MQPNILIVGVLFPAIPLMMINFGSRYSLLAGLIRSLAFFKNFKNATLRDHAHHLCLPVPVITDWPLASFNKTILGCN